MEFEIERVAAEFRANRARKGVSQRDVANSIGVNENTIINYENGKTMPDYQTAWKLADYYGVTLDALGGRE